MGEKIMKKIGLFDNASNMMEEVEGNAYELYEHKFDPIDNPYFKSETQPQIATNMETQESTQQIQKGGKTNELATSSTIIENKASFKAKVEKFQKDLIAELVEEITEEVEEKCDEL